jgi:hypothetical protein
MAEELTSSGLESSGRSRTGSHQWDVLLDGQIYALDPDVDFGKASLQTMKALLRRKARDRGMKVRTGMTTTAHVEAGEVEKEGLLVIQAYRATPEEIAEWARQDAEKAEPARQAARIEEEYERAMTEHQEEERRRAGRPRPAHEEPIRDWDFD